jgi:hypothetical protein
MHRLVLLLIGAVCTTRAINMPCGSSFVQCDRDINSVALSFSTDPSAPLPPTITAQSIADAVAQSQRDIDTLYNGTEKGVAGMLGD